MYMYVQSIFKALTNSCIIAGEGRKSAQCCKIGEFWPILTIYDYK